MGDTSPEVEQKFREILLARSGAERMLMGASMYDTARAFVLASLPDDLSPDELKRRIFRRFYGSEIDQVLKIVRDGPEI